MEWSNEVVLEFLDLYEGEPTIWDPQHSEHKDRNKIYEAWKRIHDSISIECSLKELKKKKENLMATYRKLAIKVMKRSRRTVAGTKEPYKPEWFAYDKMASILQGIYTPRKRKQSDATDASEDDCLKFNVKCEQTSTENTYIPDGSLAPPSKRKLIEIEELMPEAFKKLGGISDAVKEDDRYDLFGKYVADKLRNINPEQLKFAQKLISDVLFEAEMDSLSRFWEIRGPDDPLAS